MGFFKDILKSTSPIASVIIDAIDSNQSEEYVDDNITTFEEIFEQVCKLADDDEYEEEGSYNHARRGRSGRMNMYHKRHHDYYDADYDNEYEYELDGTYNMRGGSYAMDGYGTYARGRKMSRY